MKLSKLVLIFIVIAVTYGSAENSDNAVPRGFDAKGMLSSLAGSLMSRGYGTTGNGGSQVVALNLTNLFVLVLLKALIFAAGTLGAGAWKGEYARSNDQEEKLLTEQEILLYLSYLTGTTNDNDCLKNIACQDPKQAEKYVAAGSMLLKATKMLSLEPDISYEYTLQDLQEAASVGLSGQDCRRFTCASKQNTRNKQ